MYCLCRLYGLANGILLQLGITGNREIEKSVPHMGAGSFQKIATPNTTGGPRHR